ncbi:uncharacterized protein LOC123321055 [Coccinella septempunctata]|uniref:uncharacterized protein LOC123321055 n=1 Tax=Coccinella septempunctata TaxID=41139 RepID=UPI001D0795C6|nr:uncharacterized protein LOC123321055 [Coccinella septempunctata]
MPLQHSPQQKEDQKGGYNLRNRSKSFNNILEENRTGAVKKTRVVSSRSDVSPENTLERERGNSSPYARQRRNMPFLSETHTVGDEVDKLDDKIPRQNYDADLSLAYVCDADKNQYKQISQPMGIAEDFNFQKRLSTYDARDRSVNNELFIQDSKIRHNEMKTSNPNERTVMDMDEIFNYTLYNVPKVSSQGQSFNNLVNDSKKNHNRMMKDSYSQSPNGKDQYKNNVQNIVKQGDNLEHLLKQVISTMNQINLNVNRDNQQDVYNIPRNNVNNFEASKKLPVFDDTGTLHPMEFLEVLEYAMISENIPFETFKFIIRNQFRGAASLWSQAFLHTFADFESFKVAFKDQFWSETKQVQVKIDLQSRCYREGQSSLVNYFMKNVAMARYLNPPYSESLLIKTIARHFPPNISATLMGAQCLAEAMERLRQADYYMNHISNTNKSSFVSNAGHFQGLQKDNRVAFRRDNYDSKNKRISFMTTEAVDETQASENEELPLV